MDILTAAFVYDTHRTSIYTIVYDDMTLYGTLFALMLSALQYSLGLGLGWVSFSSSG